MSLYHKYRPTSLETVKGNSDVIATLEGMFSKGKAKYAHAFLLHGATGCGKTTIGRIIADKLGCTGSDFKEIDSAHFRGIDTVRDLRNSCSYKPIESTCKVFLIDECHKLTNDAQNALLKILEDTPDHIYFILCTTEPTKLLAAIKGRCMELQVKPLTDTQMKGLLRKIVTEEQEKISQEIYEQIILDSQGHPRKAIQILEQVLNVDEERRLDVARQTAAMQTQSIELCRALLKNSSWKEISNILNGIKDQEPEDIRRLVMGYCQSVLLKSDNIKAGLVLEHFIEPFYNSGFPGLVLACYLISKN